MSSYPDFRPRGRVITWRGPEHDVALDGIEDDTGGLTLLAVAVVGRSKGTLCINGQHFTLLGPFRLDFAIPFTLKTVEIRTGAAIYRVYPEILRRTSWARLLDD